MLITLLVAGYLLVGSIVAAFMFIRDNWSEDDQLTITLMAIIFGCLWPLVVMACIIFFPALWYGMLVRRMASFLKSTIITKVGKK